jgi:hypothetical protein
VSAENAKQAAADLVASLQIPEHREGKRFQLVTFLSDADCRFFYPQRALKWQQQVNTFVSRMLRQNRIRVNRLFISPLDYQRWRGDRRDSAILRRQFIDQHLEFVGEDSSTSQT